LKLLIVVLARKWAVLLSNCKWAVVNSVRIKNGLYTLTNREWAICSLPHTCGPSKLTRMQGFVNNTRFYQLWPLDVHPMDVMLLLQSRIFLLQPPKNDSSPDIWGASFRRLTCRPTKLTRTKGFVNLVNINNSSCSDRLMSIQRP